MTGFSWAHSKAFYSGSDECSQSQISASYADDPQYVECHSFWNFGSQTHYRLDSTYLLGLEVKIVSIPTGSMNDFKKYWHSSF
jgi:hypothetical protein